VHSLIQELAVIARQVHASDDFDGSLARITATVVHAVGGCESASITLITQAGPVTRGRPTRAVDEDASALLGFSGPPSTPGNVSSR
jgi:hypothetical protein